MRGSDKTSFYFYLDDDDEDWSHTLFGLPHGDYDLVFYDDNSNFLRTGRFGFSGKNKSKTFKMKTTLPQLIVTIRNKEFTNQSGSFYLLDNMKRVIANCDSYFDETGRVVK